MVPLSKPLLDHLRQAIPAYLTHFEGRSIGWDIRRGKPTKQHPNGRAYKHEIVIDKRRCEDFTDWYYGKVHKQWRWEQQQYQNRHRQQNPITTTMRDGTDDQDYKYLTPKTHFDIVTTDELRTFIDKLPALRFPEDDPPDVAMRTIYAFDQWVAEHWPRLNLWPMVVRGRTLWLPTNGSGMPPSMVGIRNMQDAGEPTGPLPSDIEDGIEYKATMDDAR